VSERLSPPNVSAATPMSCWPKTSSCRRSWNRSSGSPRAFRAGLLV